MNNGGMLFRWVQDEFAASEVETAKRLGINSYDVLTRIAERVTAGSEGLLFHPYLSANVPRSGIQTLVVPFWPYTPS